MLKETEDEKGMATLYKKIHFMCHMFPRQVSLLGLETFLTH